MPDLRELFARAVGPVPRLDADSLRRRIGRRRRRRAVVAAVVVAGAVAAVVALALGSRTTGSRVVVGPGTSRPPASTPTTTGRRGPLGYPVVAMHPEVFRGFGRLVYYSGLALHVLDGRGGQPRSIPIPAAPEKVRWSYDGKWFAVQTQSTGLHPSDLLVGRPGSTGLVPVGTQAAVGDWAWSPVADVLAVAEPGPTARGAIALYSADRPGTAMGTPLAASGAVFVAWSPDGTRLVYDTYTPKPPFVDDLWSVDVSGCPARCGAPRRVAIRVSHDRNEDVGLAFAGWSADGTRLLVWLDVAHSGSILMDGLRVESVPFAPGANATGSDAVLPVMLAKPSWIAPVPGGSRAVVDVGGGRVWDQPRRLDACDLATGRCSPLVSGAGPVLDPAVSPDGSRLAYVATDHAVFANNEELPPKSSRRWTKSRRLVITGSRPPAEGRRVIVTGGVVAPRWMADSRHLIFWRAGYLWLVDADHPAPVAIAGQLAARADDGFGFGPFEDYPYILPGNDVWDSADWHP